jgi:hypothetical protein
MTTTTLSTPATFSWSRVALVLAAWGTSALAVALSGVMAGAPAPVIPAVLAGSVTAFFLAARRPGAARTIAARLDLRVAIALHVLRAPIGVGFLLAAAAGTLPRGWALVAGWGDVAVGLLALAALAAWPRHPRLVAAWNLLALIDIVVVVAGAQRILFFGEPVPAFAAFPFPLLPFFVVPLVFITHGIIWTRLRGGYRA